MALGNIQRWLRNEYPPVDAAFYAKYLNIGPWFSLEAYELHREIAIVAVVALAWALWPGGRVFAAGAAARYNAPHE
jgi:hypothetical protein